MQEHEIKSYQDSLEWVRGFMANNDSWSPLARQALEVYEIYLLTQINSFKEDSNCPT